MEKKDIIQSFKDSLFTGLIALALFGPIVGLRTASKGEGLFITPQWGVVFLLVGLCILGRFLINLNSARKTEITFFSKFTSKFSAITEDKAKHFAITAILFAVVFPFLTFYRQILYGCCYNDFNLHHAWLGFKYRSWFSRSS